MPYQMGKRLSGERASKLGHLDVVNSELVNELIQKFEDQEPAKIESPANWEAIPDGEIPLRLIFAVDGSKQTIRSDFPPYKELSFIKTALLRLDQHAIEKLDPLAPHPMALRDIMSDSGMYHATVLPLKGVNIKGLSNYDAVRKIIFDSMQDRSLNAEPYKTLKWLAYEKWSGQSKSSPSFGCPHCEMEVCGLPFDQDEGACEHCGGHLYLTDMIGFHLEMSDDAAPDSVATAYMLIHETLLLFTGIRFFWEAEKYSVLGNALFIKDGPLFLKGQYSKLVIPLRNFFEFAKHKNIAVHVVGQEKTGAFFDHLEIIARNAPVNTFFAPSNEYIRKEIQHRPERSEPYGSRTNYGNKIFVKYDEYHHLVLSVPTGKYTDTHTSEVFISLSKILASLPPILSHRYECALVPIELANGVASLSSYPSAAILKVFAEI
ncbi:hypothetical protein EKK97_03655 [Billgrantia tianxiuensis]|uniref:NurA domain-containing protein n=1 Tax=Billgrantia tianxiuensis TaxID=2497861 RepID=A0A6I6SNA8_9GAMM|nr:MULTISPECIES: hypothetical protein [Halomonas]MCE8033115.1 hypothetical protein [Halomonas sp. MCCC 1A11057]QHC48885.1 hypothetical protein EKK97_03655 [Halomonas tianxiuensis]